MKPFMSLKSIRALFEKRNKEFEKYQEQLKQAYKKQSDDKKKDNSI